MREPFGSRRQSDRGDRDCFITPDRLNPTLRRKVKLLLGERLPLHLEKFGGSTKFERRTAPDIGSVQDLTAVPEFSERVDQTLEIPDPQSNPAAHPAGKACLSVDFFRRFQLGADCAVGGGSSSSS